MSYLLGEAYAFGVVWSFFLKSLGVLVLRYQAARSGIQDSGQFPASADVEIPVGLATTTLILFLVAIANLFSKQIATIYGVGFTVFLFVIFTVSEQINKRRSKLDKKRPGRIQPGHAAGGHRRDRSRASRLRAGGGARLQPHGAPAERAARRPICAATTSW